MQESVLLMQNSTYNSLSRLVFKSKYKWSPLNFELRMHQIKVMLMGHFHYLYNTIMALFKNIVAQRSNFVQCMYDKSVVFSVTCHLLM